MTRTTRMLGWALWAASSLSLASAPALAQEAEVDETETVEDEITVVGERKAYRGNFEEIEIPAADQLIDEELLVEFWGLVAMGVSRRGGIGVWRGRIVESSRWVA